MEFLYHWPFFPYHKKFHWRDLQQVLHLSIANNNESLHRWSRLLPAKRSRYLSPNRTSYPDQFEPFLHPVLSCEKQHDYLARFEDTLLTEHWLLPASPGQCILKKRKRQLP